MIRETLTELHGAAELEIVKKVRHLRAIRSRRVIRPLAAGLFPRHS